MPWRPHSKVKVSARQPRAAGKCDRCGFLYNHNTLRWQFDYSGLQFQNLRILVCGRCEDKPQRQLGAKILRPDPLPIFNARPEPFTTTGFSYQESNVMSQPPLGLDFNSDFNSDFANPFVPQGFDGDGSQMTMPDGTLMLMPDNPPGVAP